jgi:hypothetical protein
VKKPRTGAFKPDRKPPKKPACRHRDSVERLFTRPVILRMVKGQSTLAPPAVDAKTRSERTNPRPVRTHGTLAEIIREFNKRKGCLTTALFSIAILSAPEKNQIAQLVDL